MAGTYYNGIITVNTQTSDYTLTSSDNNQDSFILMNVGTANTLTVPPNSSIPMPIGRQILLQQYGAGQTTITAGAGVTIRSSGSKLKTNVQYSVATLVKIGADEWSLVGDLIA
jgi:hypothetical protein